MATIKMYYWSDFTEEEQHAKYLEVTLSGLCQNIYEECGNPTTVEKLLYYTAASVIRYNTKQLQRLTGLCQYFLEHPLSKKETLLTKYLYGCRVGDIKTMFNYKTHSGIYNITKPYADKQIFTPVHINDEDIKLLDTILTVLQKRKAFLC